MPGGRASQPAEEDTADILYTTKSEAGAVFAERRLAEHVATIYDALRHSTTWREFAAAMPANEYARTLEYQGLEPDEVDLDAPFDPNTVGGYADGTYPTWLQAEAVKWFPQDLIDKYGRNEEAAKFFQDTLASRNGAKARGYLADRGLDSAIGAMRPCRRGRFVEGHRSPGSASERIEARIAPTIARRASRSRPCCS